ncbi:peptidyl-prolyl cis-trans isomerase [Paenibacillus sp. MWE-103]|uniref:peptidylprolyl isomerase n=1 Tax=Paenibacillus artemisiicola TaxID=1172618 RepID=A0ABS3WIK3_9BACL|nr:peptidylprolyl isomerase [Paenibacillus artemisiicola]MBO7748125.1 peptidyl-prolyl cis-trans isomerase [Paenibacillus artemisiicola]
MRNAALKPNAPPAPNASKPSQTPGASKPSQAPGAPKPSQPAKALEASKAPHASTKASRATNTSRASMAPTAAGLPNAASEPKAPGASKAPTALPAPASRPSGRGLSASRLRRPAVLAVAAALALALAVAAVLLPRHGQGGDPLRAAATVDGAPIAAAELAQAMAAQKAKTAAYYRTTYGAEDGPGFWTTPLGGETPLAKLKRDALAETVRLKAQQLLAVREGLTDDVSYGAFLKRLKAENARRAKAGADGPGVYGPAQYTEAAYYNLQNSDLLGALKEKLEGGMAWTDERLRAYYGAHAAEFADQAAVQADVVAVSFAPGASLSEREAEEAARAIAAKLDRGLTAAEAASGYADAAKVTAFALDAKTARTAALQTPRLASGVQELRPGERTAVLRENGAYVVGVVTKRTPGAAHPFGDVRDGIRARLADEAYAALVDEAVKDVKVVVRHDVYDRLAVDAQR